MSKSWTLFLFLAYRYPNPNRQKCDYNNPPAPGKVCGVDLEELGVCSPKNNYGLQGSSACVFLKLRHDPSWTPEYFNSTELPSELPNHLKDYIDRNVAVKNKVRSLTSCCDQRNLIAFILVENRLGNLWRKLTSWRWKRWNNFLHTRKRIPQDSNWKWRIGAVHRNLFCKSSK